MRNTQNKSRNPLWQQICFVLISVGMATGLTQILRHYLHEETPPFLLYFAAVAICAGFGGLWPGLVATLLSALAAGYLIIDPNYSSANWSRVQTIQVGLFVTVSLIVSCLSERLQFSLRRAEVARDESERAKRRIAFLAEASAALDMSLDYRTNLSALARKAVPFLADWCSIDLIGPGQTITSLAVAHRNPDMEELVHRLDCRYPLDPSGMHPIHRAIQTGRSDIYLDIQDSALVNTARDEEHLNLLRDLQIRSYLCVPLKGREGIIGSLLFVHSARRRYEAADRELAEDLAQRAALAMDNARLYEAAQEEIAERTRAEAQVERLNARLKRAIIETNHRVKNNLQVITAMLDMRLMDGDENIPAEEIHRIGASIKTLAAVHDILTLETRDSGEQSDVSMKSILEKLLPLMQQTSGERRIRYELEDIRLPVKQATSLALIVNELVSNGLKYGRGDIEIEMQTDGPDTPVGDAVLTLSVCDDGPGFPPDFNPATAANTGLDLIDNLSRWDLGGKACFENRSQGGARVVIYVPLRTPTEPQNIPNG